MCTHSCVSLQLSVIADDGVICTIYTEYIADVAAAVAETRSSPLPQPINYGHTGDKKGKIFLLTLHTLVCYQTKCMNVCSLLLSFEYKKGKKTLDVCPKEFYALSICSSFSPFFTAYQSSIGLLA